MAKLQHTAESFVSDDVFEAAFRRRFRRINGEPVFVRIDCILTFWVRGAAGDRIDTFKYTANDTGSSWSFFTPAFRQTAWNAYLASKNFTEV